MGWRIAAGFGWCLWLLAIAASGAMNAFAGYGLGRSVVEGLVLASLSVAADGWKAMAPLYISMLVRRGSFGTVLFSSMIWLACFVYAVGSAIGFAGLNRAVTTGGRDSLRAAYTNTMNEMGEVRAQRAQSSEQRSSSELEETIKAALLTPVGGRGTVGSISDDCAQDNSRTRDACVAIARLRITLARANDVDRMRQRFAELEAESQRLSKAGGNAAGDPQEQLIAKLSGGWVKVGDVGLLLVLTLVAMVELISAFGPVVLGEFVRGHREPNGSSPIRDQNLGGRQVEGQLVGDVYEFLAKCVQPAPDESIAVNTLVKRYTVWCQDTGHAALGEHVFVSEFDRICSSDLEGRVKRLGFRVKGLRVLDSAYAPLSIPPRS